MRKSTIAAVTAAAFLGFGTAGTAMAGTEVSGFADINWDVFNNNTATDFEEGDFRASGEIDIIEKADGATFRGDFDLNNCHNSSPGTDLPTGTDPGLDATGSSLGCGTGVDIEQLKGMIPVNNMATVTAGIFNSFHGLEGQDATDYNFAANGLLWTYVPSNLAGAMVEVTPTDMVAVKVGYINSWTDLAQAGDTANDVIAGVWVAPIEGLDVNLSYLTDETEGLGDEFDINATLSMVENLVISLEYLMADPASTSASFDNGYGITASYAVGDITVAGRYEAATFEGAGPDVTAGSASVGYNLAANTLVRLDFTSVMVDTVNNSDMATIQLVHTFDGMDSM
jgi:hypothetical protein